MKKILLVIGVLLGIFIPERVLAATFSVSDTYPENIIKEGNGITEVIHVKRVIRKDDNRFVYLLDSNSNVGGNSLIPSDTYNKVSDAVLENLKLISYYGYNYTNHNDSKWYIITQLMIWNEIDNEYTYYFENDKYSSDMEELNKLVSEHYLLPSFANQKILVDSTFFTDTVDNNKVLSNYEIIDKNNLSIAINKNVLNLYTKLTTDSYAKFAKRANKYKNQPEFYINDNGTDILLPGNFNDIYFSVAYHVMKGNIKISLIDKSTNVGLGNVSFSLLDGKKNFIKEVKTNNNGEIIFSDLTYGNYYIRQDNTTKGYLYSVEPRSLSMHSELNEIVIYNELAKGRVKIYTNGIKEVEFCIYNNSDKCINSFVTDGRDYYEFELPYGIYYISSKDNNIYETNYYEFEIDNIDKIFDMKSDKLSEIITVPDTHINKVNYISYLYAFLIISGLFVCGVKYEKK